MAEPGNRLEFVQTLRGVAALTVVATHFLIAFWINPTSVAVAAAVPVYSVQDTALPFLWPRFLVEPGSFGVAIFFLISGLVIPMSIERYRIAAFLIARAYRILPLIAVGLAISAAAISIATWHYGTVSPFTLQHYIGQLLLVRDGLNLQAINSVFWTLEIEVRFYLIMALFAAALRAGRVVPIISLAATVAVFSVALRHITYRPTGTRLGELAIDMPYFAWWAATSVTLTFVVYMLIGVITYFHLRRRLKTGQAVGAGALIFLLFVLSAATGRMSATWPLLLRDYGVGLLVFVLCYVYRAQFRRTAILSWLGDISYPLYLCHTPVGYLMMRLLLDLGWPPVAIVSSTLSVVLALSAALHIWIEGPMLEMGKRIAGRWPAMPAPRLSRPAIL